jgi:hypothetical protein
MRGKSVREGAGATGKDEGLNIKSAKTRTAAGGETLATIQIFIIWLYKD